MQAIQINFSDYMQQNFKVEPSTVKAIINRKCLDAKRSKNVDVQLNTDLRITFYDYSMKYRVHRYTTKFF